MNKFLLALAVLSLTIAVILGNFSYLLFNEDFYKDRFSELGVYENVAEADSINNAVLGYFKDEGTLITVEAFTPKEKEHLYDVKALISIVLIMLDFFIVALIVSLALIFIYSKNFFEEIKKILLYSGAATIAAVFGLSILSLFFSTSFTLFHMALFEPGSWVFSPDDYLIMLYPFEFFRSFFLKIIVESSISGASLLMAGLVMKLFTTISR